MENISVKNRLEIINSYLLTKNVSLETLQMIINEDDNAKLIKNLFNCYNVYVNKINLENECPTLNFINNMKKILIEIINSDCINNYDYYIGKIRKIKKTIVTFKDKNKNHINYEKYKLFIDEIIIITNSIENILMNKISKSYKDNSYDFLNYVICDIQNKKYLDYILTLYPHYINAKNDDNEHIILNVFSRFLEEISNSNKVNNLNKIFYYESVIDKFITDGRFKISNQDLRKLKIDALEYLKELEKNKKYIRKYSQKEICLKSIINKLDSDSNNDFYESIENLNKKYNVRTGFSIMTQKEIEELTIDNGPLIITIDDDNTLDMDDAVSIRKNIDTYTISIFISDVASVVKPNTSIDIEAFNRFSTLYLSDKTIPMLPFELSNDLLSLNSNGNKNVIVYEIEISKNGEIIKSSIATRQINITNKLSYNNVNTYLKNGSAPNKVLYETVKDLSDLSMILRKNNTVKNSYRQIEDLSKKVEGKVLETDYKNRTKSEIIIEELMILGNVVPAEYCYKNSIPYIYRVHPKIEDSKDYEALSKLKQIVNTEYYKISNEEYLDVIRSLIKMYPNAYYSIENIGHFGLGLDVYSHSTSPIRRYPDLINQRITHDLILQKPTDKKIKYWEKALDGICNQMNVLEETTEKYAHEYEKIKSLKKRG